VRHVAGFTAIDPYRGVLINKGPSLVGMALQARFLVPLLLVHHARARRHPPGRGESAVGVVTIRAFHNTFIHAMLEGHGKLRLHRGMARVAELGLFLSEEKFRRLRVVNGVAIRADHVLLGMNAAADVGPRNRLGVAAKAGVQRLFRSDLGERDDGRLAAARFDVSFARSVAALAAGIFWRFGAAGNAFVMRVAEKLGNNQVVTGLTSVAADIIGGL